MLKNWSYLQDLLKNAYIFPVNHMVPMNHNFHCENTLKKKKVIAKIAFKRVIWTWYLGLIGQLCFQIFFWKGNYVKNKGTYSRLIKQDHFIEGLNVDLSKYLKKNKGIWIWIKFLELIIEVLSLTSLLTNGLLCKYHCLFKFFVLLQMSHESKFHPETEDHACVFIHHDTD